MHVTTKSFKQFCTFTFYICAFDDIYKTSTVDVGVCFFATTSSSASSSSSSSAPSPLLLKPYQHIVARPIKALMMQATTVPMAFGVQPDTRGFGPAASVPKFVVFSIKREIASVYSPSLLRQSDQNSQIEVHQHFQMKACPSFDIALKYMKVS